MMNTDRLFKRRAVRTSLVAKAKDALLTLTFLFVMLVVPVIHLATLNLFAIVGVFSWTLTGESAQPHHYLFLLPYLPTILVFPIQFGLFQHYVKPSNAHDQWFAFLSNILPVRIFLIPVEKTAWTYYFASITTNATSMLISWVILFFVSVNLPEEEDNQSGFAIYFMEVILPLAFVMVTIFLTASSLLWLLVISPGLSFYHCCPDFQPLQERVTSFPYFWKDNAKNPVSKARAKASIQVDWATPSDFAEEGFFYSDPRLAELQVRNH